MKKRILFLLLALTLLCALCVGTSVTVFAEEVAETEITTEIEETLNDKELTAEEVEAKLAELIAKVNSLTGEDNFFKNKILPWLIAGITDLAMVGFLIIRPYIKSKNRAKQLEGYVQALQNDKENLTTLLSSTDAPAIQKAIADMFGNYIENTMKLLKSEFGSYMNTFVSMKTTIETTYAQMKALCDAARQAWAAKPEVVALLAESPEKSTLEAQAKENEKLKNYIREIKGEEAEKIISDLGVV